MKSKSSSSKFFYRIADPLVMGFVFFKATAGKFLEPIMYLASVPVLFALFAPGSLPVLFFTKDLGFGKETFLLLQIMVFTYLFFDFALTIILDGVRSLLIKIMMMGLVWLVIGGIFTFFGSTR